MAINALAANRTRSRLSIISLIVFSLLLCVGFTPAALAQNELQGAAAILESVSQPADAQGDEAETPADALRTRMLEFQAAVDTLPAQQAADTWLQLLRDVLDTPPSRNARFAQSQLAEAVDAGITADVNGVFSLLPPPPAWSALAQAINNLPEDDTLHDHQLDLRLLTATLTADHPARAETVNAIIADAAENPDTPRAYMADQLISLLPDDSVQQTRTITRQVNQLLQQAITDPTGYHVVPELLPHINEQTARALLLNILKLPAPNLRFEQRGATFQLARQIAAENIDQITIPRWSFISEPDQFSITIYEGFAARSEAQAVPAAEIDGFGVITDSPTDADINRMRIQAMRRNRGLNVSGWDYERQSAWRTYILALALNNRLDTLRAELQQNLAANPENFAINNNQVVQLRAAGTLAAFSQTLLDLLPTLTDSPTSSAWSTARTLALHADHLDRLATITRAAVEDENASVENRLVHLRNLADTLLADGQVDPAIETQRAVIALAQENEELPAAFTAAASLASLGHLLDRPQLFTEGLDAALANRQTEPQENDPYRGRSQTESLVTLLILAERPAEAEQLLAEQFRSAIAAEAEAPRDEFYSYSNRNSSGSALAALVEFYYVTDRAEDVLTLLRSAPQWPVPDLLQAENAVGSFSYSPGRNSPLTYKAAWALVQTGRNDEALPLIEHTLRNNPGHDPTYQLLLQVRGTASIEFLDQLYSRDSFEERPLIWKAEQLRRDGRLAEAEATARQAITIDPSDGEQGKGDRMRVYAVLADILRDAGNPEAENFFREVVAAIRMAEDADDLYDAGLKRRGIELYQQSLTHFADAYCIQSRLAVQLMELGLTDAATEHYTRAFELMPDSFGRVESHCFGCEGAFSGRLAQSLADEVFQRMLINQPNNPRIHYLLGYLRYSQQRYEESAEHYSRAAELDPDYLNAWAKLNSLSRQISFTPERQDAIIFAMLRLDPLGRHSYPSFESVTDLATLWTHLDNAIQLRWPQPDSLFPLTAAAQRINELAVSAEQQMIERYSSMSYNSYTGIETTKRPADILMARHNVFRIVTQLLQSNGYY